MSLAGSASIPPAAPIDTYQLKAELKEWEHDFLAATGRKPGKSDIKANRDMASKYKLYDRLTRGLSTKPKPSTSTSTTTSPSKKRKRDSHRDSGISPSYPDHDNQENLAPPTPQKTSSPSLKADGTIHPSTLDPYDPPLNTLFSPLSQRTYIGPTPQKNGRVLGLFDLLSPESARKSTPSKSRCLTKLPNGTPSQTRVRSLDLHSTTPSRRDALTPSKNRANGAVVTPSLQRGRKLDLNLDETPECLRRYPRKIAPTSEPAETGEGFGDADGLMNIAWSPVAVRQPRKRFGRSFSELAKDIKRREEKLLDDELDVLDEMEAEASRPVKKVRGEGSEPLGRDVPKANVAVASDDLPLGPDGEREGERIEDDDEAPKDSQAGQRRWKKKGPKRQTKKFNIRPNHAKWKPEPEWKAGVDESDGEDKEVAHAQIGDVVPETQVAAKTTGDDSDDSGSAFESEDELASELDVSTRKTVKKASEQSAKLVKAEKPKKAKKVSATAHANYRSLKIRNKNSKGKKGGRFGRGRR